MFKAIIFTCLAIFLVQLDATVLYIAFSSIGSSFSTAGAAAMGWVLNAYTLTFGALLIPAGAAGDRFGRKKIFIAGVSLFTLASFFCGFATSIDFLILMRFMQAVGAALLVPTSLALLLQEIPHGKRTVAISFWGASGALGAAIGPALGGILIANLSWHWVFFINVPIGIFVAVAANRGLSESAPHEDRTLPSLLGVSLVIAAMACLSFSVLKEGNAYSGLPASLVATVGLILLALFVWHSRKSRNPLIDLALFRDRTFSTANGATFLYFIAFSIIFFGNVQSLINEWYNSVAVTGLLMLPGPLFVIPSAVLSGRYARMHGHRRLLVLGSIAAMLGIFLQHLLGANADSVFTTWIPGWILVGIGNGMVMPGLAGSATMTLSPQFYSAGSGINNSIRQFGGLLGIAVAISFIGNGQVDSSMYRNMFLLAFGIVGAVAALSLIINTHPLRSAALEPVKL